MKTTDPYRDVARLLITRIMSKVPVSASKEHLQILLGRMMPQYRSELSIAAWNLEKSIAVAEWNQDMPGMTSEASVSCSGGPLVQEPISTATPIPLPSEKREQTNLL